MKQEPNGETLDPMELGRSSVKTEDEEVLLKTEHGETIIKTDQTDGENYSIQMPYIQTINL